MRYFFQIIKIEENKDGSATLYAEYDKRFEDIVKTSYGKKRCSKKLVSQFILRAIKDGIKQEMRKIK